MPSEIIDFYDERARHKDFFAREDILREIDEILLRGPDKSGWLLLQGGPGMGKSALLSHWLGPLEGQPRWPHHFIRRNVEGWDQPQRIVSSLAAQLEARYPAQRDAEARPEARLGELLRRISREMLRGTDQRLVLVIDGLDEASPDGTGNPLPRFLPAPLPAGVLLLCASRPDYPNLEWLLAQPGGRRIDMDEPGRAAANVAACRAFWAHHGSLLRPPLDPAFMAEAVQRAEGNLLHAVKLLEWLREVPAQKRMAVSIPRGLRGLLEQVWQGICRLPESQRDRVLAGLGLLCAALEALPLPILDLLAGWQDPTYKDDFLRITRAFLLEQPEYWEGQVAYRPYHESFRKFVTEKLGPRAMNAHQEALARVLAAWPPQEGADPFCRRYAQRHGVHQHIKAHDWEGVHRMCTDLTYWRTRYEAAGVSGMEVDLQRALAYGPGQEEDGQDKGPGGWTERRRVWQDLLRALRDESHWWRVDGEALPELIYGWLRCRGWDDGHIRSELSLGKEGKGKWLLLHPLQRQGSSACIRTLSGHTNDVIACAVTHDGQRVVSASCDNTLKVWDLRSGQELLSLSGHSAWVMDCAVMPDGKRAVSASLDRTLKVWDLASGACLATVYGTGQYACVAAAHDRIFAGDGLGNVCFLHLAPAEPQPKTSAKLEPTTMPDLLYIGYARGKDDALAQELENQLAPLEKLDPPLQRWSERNIPPGATTDREIEHHLSQARIIVLVVTANFLADDHCQDLLARALKRRADGKADVIPILADYCMWDLTPLGQLNPLPDRDRPVKAWTNRNEAWNKIVRGLLQLVAPSSQQPPAPPSSSPGPSDKPAGTAQPPKFHAALLTAIDHEIDMVFEALRQLGIETEFQMEGDKVFHTFKLPRSGQGEPLRALVAQATDKGALAAQSLVHAIVQAGCPELFLLTGVCGGFSGRMNQGDVLVARNLFYYEPARLVPGKMELRPAPYKTSPAVINLTRALRARGQLRDILGKAEIHVKDYATGEKVIADQDAPLRQALHELSADLYGFEMEGAGVLHALWETTGPTPVHAGVIKAASDLGDAGMKENKDERQRSAALRAARVAIEVVRHFAYKP